MRSFAFILLIIPILLLIDLYAYKGLRKVLSCGKPHLKSLFFWFWWIFSLGMAIGILVFIFQYERGSNQENLAQQVMKYNAVFAVQFAFKFVYIFFEFLRDLIFVAQKIIKRAKRTSPKPPISESRREFIRKVGVIASIIPFVGLIHGIGWGRFNFTLHH